MLYIGDGVMIPFGKVHVEDMLALIWQHPPAKEFFYGIKARFESGAEFRNEETLELVVDLISRLGSDIITKIIAISAGVWLEDAEALEAIHSWDSALRLDALMHVIKGVNFADFFERLWKLIPNTEAESQSRAAGPTQSDLEAAVQSLPAQSSGGTSTSQPPASNAAANAVATQEMPVTPRPVQPSQVEPRRRRSCLLPKDDHRAPTVHCGRRGGLEDVGA